jgi:hypothetical protein
MAVKSLLRLSWLLLLLSPAALLAAGLPVVDVYKSPSCGCCKDWIKHLEANGFKVRAHNTDDVVAHKYRLGVPPGHGSCHTAEVGGYLVEGHVPAREIKRLLQEKPKARGLAVPGMPVGSPGMEQGARRDPYEVLLITRDGATRVYARY